MVGTHAVQGTVHVSLHRWAFGETEWQPPRARGVAPPMVLAAHSAQVTASLGSFIATAGAVALAVLTPVSRETAAGFDNPARARALPLRANCRTEPVTVVVFQLMRRGTPDAIAVSP